MKYLLLSVALVGCSLVSKSQTIENDTIYYHKIKYYAGREVQIFFGSGKNGEFLYAFVGGKSRIIKDFRRTDLYPLSDHFAKAKIKLDKVYTIGNIFYARGALINWTTGDGFNDHFVYIDVKGAVDNREVWEDSIK